MTAPSPAPPQPRNRLGTTAVVLAIVGIVLSWIPLVGYIGVGEAVRERVAREGGLSATDWVLEAFVAFVLGMIGLVLGVLGWRRACKGQADNPKVSILGAVLSVAAIVFSIWAFVAFNNALNCCDTSQG